MNSGSLPPFGSENHDDPIVLKMATFHVTIGVTVNIANYYVIDREA